MIVEGLVIQAIDVAFITVPALTPAEQDSTVYVFPMTIPGISTSVRFFIELVVSLKYSVLFYFLCDCGWILTQFNTYCPERYGSIQSLLDNNPVILIHMFLVCFYFLRHQGDYSSICEWVQTGAVDFGFANPAAVKRLETQFVKSDPFVAVLPKNHKELVLQKTSYNVAVLSTKDPILRTMAIITKDKRSLSFAAKTFMQYILD